MTLDRRPAVAAFRTIARSGLALALLAAGSSPLLAAEPAGSVAVGFGRDGKELVAEFDRAATMAVRRGSTVLVRSAGLRLVGAAGAADPGAFDVEAQEEPGGLRCWSISGARAPGGLRARLRALRSGGALALAWERSFQDPSGLDSWAYVLDLPAAVHAGRELCADGRKLVLPRAAAPAGAAQLFDGPARSVELRDGGKVYLRMLLDSPRRLVVTDLRPEGRDGFGLAVMGAPAGDDDRMTGSFCLALAGSDEPIPPLVYHAELLPPVRPGAPLVGELGLLAEYRSPFDPTEIAVDAVVTPPGGAEPFRQPAFWFQDYRLETFKEEPPAPPTEAPAANGAAAAPPPAPAAEPVERERLVPWGTPGWRARIAVERPGSHRLIFEVRTPAGAARVEPRPALVPGPLPVASGPLKPSAADPRYLADPAGKGVFLVGHNLGWLLSPRPVAAWTEAFERMRKAGLNYARIWNCTWSLPIETAAPYAYDLESAWRLDRVFEESGARGIHVQLCLDNFDDFLRKRDKSPYFSAAGGCKSARDFFESERARAMYRARLRYLVGRWGCSERLLAWELFNELDYCVDKNGPEDQAAARKGFLVPWARWAAGELRALDRGRHMITCSLSDGDVWPELSGAAEMDLAENHLYLYMPEAGKAGRTEREAFSAATAEVTRYGKPALVSEYGFGADGGPKSEINELDRLGVHLHNGLWLSTMSGHAGAAALWWWDSYLAPSEGAPASSSPAALAGTATAVANAAAKGAPDAGVSGDDRYGHYRALAAYVKDVDWLAGWKPLVVAPPEGGAPGAAGATDIVGLRTDRAALFWLSDPANTWFNRSVGKARPKRIERAGFAIDGLAPGAYVLEWWDAYTGRVLTSSRVATDAAGSLRVEAPAFTRDIAGKLRPAGGRASQ